MRLRLHPYKPGDDPNLIFRFFERRILQLLALVAAPSGLAPILTGGGGQEGTPMPILN